MDNEDKPITNFREWLDALENDALYLKSGRSHKWDCNSTFTIKQLYAILGNIDQGFYIRSNINEQ